MSSLPTVLKSSPVRCCGVPLPDDAYWNLPCCDLMCAISSCRFFAGTDGCATSTSGTRSRFVTGVELGRGIERHLLVHARVDHDRCARRDQQQRSRQPAALATYADPMLPPAPPRFSTTNGWPSPSCRPFATGRAAMSDGPPAGHGTTTVTGLLSATPERRQSSLRSLAPSRSMQRTSASAGSLHHRLLRKRFDGRFGRFAVGHQALLCPSWLATSVLNAAAPANQGRATSACGVIRQGSTPPRGRHELPERLGRQRLADPEALERVAAARARKSSCACVPRLPRRP